MLIPMTAIIIGALGWLGNKAVPAIWQHHITTPTPTQVEQAKDLASHGDYEAEKMQALQGLKPVVRLNCNVTDGVLLDATPTITGNGQVPREINPTNQPTP